jgi:hypothetical protein
MHPIFALLANRRKQRAAVMASHDNVTDLYGDVALNSSDQHRVGFARNSHARHKPKPLWHALSAEIEHRSLANCI